jgi:CelD/BcsL family acetyltransferase involved in cellulose biosynthesis
VGIAPLFLNHNPSGQSILLLLGCIEISDYLDVIVRPKDLRCFMTALFEQLAAPQAPAWQSLDLYNLVENSATLPLLQAEAKKRGWLYDQQRLQHCPYVPLPGDWEAYLAGIDKKQRHEIRRKMRRAAEAKVPLRWYIVEDAQQLESELEDFLNLMALDENKRAFLTELMRTQMQLTVRAAFQGKWLQLAFLEVDGQKAAGYLNFDFDNRIWVYNSGLDFNFGAYSPGWVLLGHLLQWANEQQRSAFDFMRGDEDYKYRFGGIDRFVVRARVQKPA